MEQEIALSDSQSKLLSVLTESIPKDKQLSWLQLANLKQKKKEELQTKFLEMQAILIKYETMTAIGLQEALTKYNKELNQLPEIRKGYTRYLDKITNELSVIEKEADSWDILKRAKARLLSLKEEAEKKVEEVSDKEKEKQRFITHVKNQYIEIKTEYEIALGRIISEEYALSLSTPKTLTEIELKNHVIFLENKLTNTKVNDPKRFSSILPNNYKLIHKAEDFVAFHATVEKPDYSLILKNKITELKDKYSLYYQDKANADKATEFIRNQQKETEDKLKQNAATKQSVNELVEKGATTGNFNFSDLKPIERKFIIIVKDNDPEWAVRIMSEFIVRFESCRPRLKVKSWGNLSIKQMAAALQEEDDMIEGIQYEEIKK